MNFVPPLFRSSHRRFLLLSFAVLFAMTVGASAQTSRPADSHNGKTASDPYPFDTCPVTGEKLDIMGKPFMYEHEGREIRFCCDSCVRKFEANSEAMLKKMDEKIIERQLPYYPLDTCIVTGEELGGEMGEPVNFVYNNRLIRFCCKGCIRKFKKDRRGYLKKLDEAIIKKQKKDYPLAFCMITREKLDSMGGSIDRVFNNRLVRFCCKGCVPKFKKDPAKYLAMLDAVRGKKHDDQDKKSDDDHRGDRRSKHDQDGHSGHNH